MAESAGAQPAPERSDRRAVDPVDAIWRLFASPRFTLWLLVAVALAFALGAFTNPENRSLAEVAVVLGERWWFPIYRLLELHDVFHSWWFLLVAVVAGLSLVARALDRLPRAVAVVGHPEKVLSDAVLAAVPLQRTVKLPAADAAAKVAAAMRSRGFQPEPVTATDGEAAYLFAERGRLSRVGPWVAQGGAFIILVGAVVSALLGIGGLLTVPMDGGSFDFFLRRTASGISFKEPLGFTLRLDAFRLAARPGDKAPSGETDLAVVGDPGTPSQRDLVKETIRSGKSWVYGGWTFAQGRYELSPDHDRVKLHILDKQTKAERDLVLQKDGAVKVGELAFQAVNYTPDLAQLGPAVQVVRTDGAKKSSFWVLQNYPDFDTDDRGDRVGLRFDGLAPFYFTTLLVSKDPGYPIWLAGCVVLLLGLGLTFATSHRRVWAKVEPSGRVTFAGIAHQHSHAFAKRFDALVQSLGAPPPHSKAAK